MTGSSPLARGAHTSQRLYHGHGGIIPARAGSTRWACMTPWAVRDHPRSRGEHRPETGMIQKVEGSSPLARGALVPGAAGQDIRGIIPARAGSTSWRWCRRSRIRDHPRSRGEHTHPGSTPQRKPGSSPLARGAPVLVDERNVVVGIIPARAGSTPYRGRPPPIREDHPRSRGEHLAVADRLQGACGSSPLARGAPLHGLVEVERLGIIPARAGSTSTTVTWGWSTRDHPRSRGEHSLTRMP